MAARSIASLTVSFGLVSIPVKLYSATQPSGGISFNLLHKGCGSRLRQQYFCIREDVPVTREDMIKGYEFAKDQYVTFTPEELKELEEKGTGIVDITEFVPTDTIDPIYFDKAYFLAPDKGGAKPYALLAESMRETGRSAIARWAARGKQYIVQIRPVEGGLVMQQLLYAPEVRSLSDIEIAPAPVREPELALAKQLIDQISTERFDPKQYEDEVKQRIEASVQRKVEGQEIEISPIAPEAGGQVIDLMEALRASVRKSAAAGRSPAAGKAAPKKAPAPAPVEAAEQAAAAPAARKPPRKAQAEPAQQRAKSGRR